MRVIAGLAKGRRLQSVPGDSTRPITDRAKEALFSIIGTWIIDTRVLDLFGGTGAVGIEALSRGAHHVTFVDSARRSIAAVEANLADLAMSDRATVLRSEAFAALGSSAGSGPFDLVLADPPYAFDQWAELIGALAAVVTPTGVVVAESDRDLEPAVAASRSTTGAGILRQRRYGGTVVTMLTFEWSPPVPPATASGDLSDQEPGS